MPTGVARPIVTASAGDAQPNGADRISLDDMSSPAEAAVPSLGPKHRRARRGVRLLRVAGMCALFAALLYAASTPLLTAFGEQLFHADLLQRTDVIIVLASSLDRVVEGAELYRAGYAPVVILTREGSSGGISRKPWDHYRER